MFSRILHGKLGANSMHSCVLGLRTKILHGELGADVLRLASEQCPQLSELRVVGLDTAIEFEKSSELTDASTRPQCGLTRAT
jgi:hypothetical protein